jgi:acyl dehydratase
MPLSSNLVGQTTAAWTHAVDARWLMAYAAGLGETRPCYFDTTRSVVPHPVFPVCLEWDPILALRCGPGTESMTPAEQARAVHAEHDLHLLAPLRTGERYTTVATAVRVEQRKPGAYLVKRIDTTDTAGTLVCRTWQGTLYRDVALAGDAHGLEQPPPWPQAAAAPRAEHRMTVPARAAHVYTECARIWNPIHTDRAHALAAGLPDLILHGTATLALAVSALVDAYLDGDPTRVARLGCRFSGMVPMPAELTLVSAARDAATLAFDVVDAQGAPVISRGFVGCRGLTGAPY